MAAANELKYLVNRARRTAPWLAMAQKRNELRPAGQRET